jgi:hypothetical protein
MKRIVLGTVYATLATAIPIVDQPASMAQFFADQGGIINRMNDRLFVGANTIVNDGNSSATNSTKDWLETMRPATTSVSQIAALSQIGAIGVLGGIRTSDIPTAEGDGEALVGFCVSNATTTGAKIGKDCWGGYFEARRMPGVHPHNEAIGVEIDTVELNNVDVPLHPYTGAGFGLSIGMYLSSGGGVQTFGETPYDASAALGIENNGAKWRSGIVFGANALTGNNGTVGTAEAIALPKGDEIHWYEPVTHTVAASIRSDAENAGRPVTMSFGVGGVTLSAASGNTLLIITSLPTSCSGLATGTLWNNSGAVNVC